jgi:uncharacterized Zn finger protein (UPF0148 family)
MIRTCEACGMPFPLEENELLCPTCTATIDELTEAALEAAHYDYDGYEEPNP